MRSGHFISPLFSPKSVVGSTVGLVFKSVIPRSLVGLPGFTDMKEAKAEPVATRVEYTFHLFEKQAGIAE